MVHRIKNANAVVWALLLAVVATAPVEATPPDVHGELTKVGDISVLTVWGTPRQRGFAQGYYLTREIIGVMHAWNDSKFSGDDEQFKKAIDFSRNVLRASADYRAELKGIVEGIVARLDRPQKHRRWRGFSDYNMLQLINSLPDLMAIGCSSFAAWGEASADGTTIAGRNLDWPNIEGMAGREVVIVNLPQADSGRLGWVSVTWPGYIGCLTGMNAEGVTVSMHDVAGIAPTHGRRSCPRGLALRDAIEAAHARTAFDDVARVLRERPTAVGNNVLVTRPFHGDIAAAVLEYDGRTDLESGITVRFPKDGLYVSCTNHHLLRGVDATNRPARCDRLETLQRGLGRIGEAGSPLDVRGAWSLLRAVTYPRDGASESLTYYSVVFEPSRLRFHLAISRDGRAAPECDVVTIDVRKLLRRLPAG